MAVKQAGGSRQLGSVRYLGAAQFQGGWWVGVRLDAPLGRNNGSVNGVRYFVCEEGHGLFVRPSSVESVDAPPRSVWEEWEDIAGLGEPSCRSWAPPTPRRRRRALPPAAEARVGGGEAAAAAVGGQAVAAAAALAAAEAPGSEQAAAESRRRRQARRQAGGGAGGGSGGEAEEEEEAGGRRVRLCLAARRRHGMLSDSFASLSRLTETGSNRLANGGQGQGQGLLQRLFGGITNMFTGGEATRRSLGRAAARRAPTPTARCSGTSSK